jgi:hypothetical protein
MVSKIINLSSSIDEITLDYKNNNDYNLSNKIIKFLKFMMKVSHCWLISCVVIFGALLGVLIIIIIVLFS